MAFLASLPARWLVGGEHRPRPRLAAPGPGGHGSATAAALRERRLPPPDRGHWGARVPKRMTDLRRRSRSSGLNETPWDDHTSEQVFGRLRPVTFGASRMEELGEIWVCDACLAGSDRFRVTLRGSTTRGARWVCRSPPSRTRSPGFRSRSCGRSTRPSVMGRSCSTSRRSWNGRAKGLEPPATSARSA